MPLKCPLFMKVHCKGMIGLDELEASISAMPVIVKRCSQSKDLVCIDRLAFDMHVSLRCLGMVCRCYEEITWWCMVLRTAG